MFGAMLDANVLVPSLLRDTLLTLGAGGMYQPRWSPVILGETRHAIRSLRDAKGQDKEQTEAYIAHLFSETERSFPDSSITGWEHLEGTFGLRDPQDEHVVAAAVEGSAGVIVTENLRDFPEAKLPGELHALSGVEFLDATIEVNPAHAAKELSLMAQRRGLSLGDLLDLMVMRLGTIPSLGRLRRYAEFEARSP